ncbi:3-deoxy-manno-octulosonate cytidylyltransferase [Halarsenatibacter silvermanii]|uniref:3-deoxy-manno-octulosonate cytidylyltransferase n=1 Tax=Halarsenatibacter silvermanii TaxID=321763 RepID=A0A1G9I0P1_9FIRM|nr:3-deoxy-manno-octulosonate cytidylyltransferase [Halarsenatibacter silvermanii]SDL18797.1 3-deoxy-manno-octulosonate cytidylyltransferase (CMP-KDO synthetase) [Halarsenatibacter silvermanii]
MKSTGIIPARYGSNRFPGKPLAEIAGKSMIERVYQRTAKTESLHDVIVATDDHRIKKEVEDFGGRAVMTDPGHSSGTDRIAEVAAGLDCELVVNVQGDEPLIRPEMIEKALRLLREDEKAVMSTLASPLSRKKIEDKNRVKVVRDRDGYALYFSRAPIPSHPENSDPPGREKSLAEPEGGPLLHIGMYVYRRDFLLDFTELDPTPLEKCESLEQLRALENGCRIRVGVCEHHGPGVDRPGDIKSVEKLLAQEGITDDEENKAE